MQLCMLALERSKPDGDEPPNYFTGDSSAKSGQIGGEIGLRLHWQRAAASVPALPGEG